MNKNALSFRQLNSIHLALLPICEKQAEYYAFLSNDNFTASHVYRDYLHSYCFTEKEKEIHDKCMVEQGKLIACTPIGFHRPVSKEDQDQQYVSLFLKELKEERDAENGMSEDDLEDLLDQKEVWYRLQFDPAQKNMAYESIFDKSRYDKKREAMREKLRSAFLRDVEKHATCLGKELNLNIQDRCNFFIQASELYGQNIGLVYDTQKSLKYNPILSVQLNEDWDLCWRIVDTNEFGNFSSQIEDINLQPRFEPKLEIRPHTWNGKEAKRILVQDYIDIRYSSFMASAVHGYSSFYTYNEFETVIKAHLTILSYFIDIIKGAIIKVNL